MVRLVSVATVLTLLAAPARADDAEKVRQLYAEAKAEYDLGHFANALAKFEATYRIKPVPALLFNIAQCHRLLGDLNSAAMTYRAFLRNDPNSPRADQAAELLKQVEEAMERQHSAQKAPPLGLTQAQESEAKPAKEPKESKEMAARPPAPVDATKAAPPPAPAEKRGRLWSYVAGGAAVVAIAGGTVFSLQANSAASELQSAPHERAEIDAKEAEIHSNSSKATALLITGAALAAVAATLWVLEF